MTYESIRIHGIAKRIHVFTNLLYEPRILTFLYSIIPALKLLNCFTLLTEFDLSTFEAVELFQPFNFYLTFVALKLLKADLTEISKEATVDQYILLYFYYGALILTAVKVSFV